MLGPPVSVALGIETDGDFRSNWVTAWVVVRSGRYTGHLTGILGKPLL